MGRTVALLLVASLTGCSEFIEPRPLPNEIYIDNTFSDLEKEIIIEGINETNKTFIRPCLGYDGLIFKGYAFDSDGFDADGSDMGDEYHIIYKLYPNEPAYDNLSDLAEREFGGYATLQDILMIRNLDSIPIIDEMIDLIEADPDQMWDPELQEELERLAGSELDWSIEPWEMVQKLRDLKVHLKKVFKRILLHEFGHHIGLLHNPDPDSLMFADVKTVDTFAEPDREAFAFVRDCSYE